MPQPPEVTHIIITDRSGTGDEFPPGTVNEIAEEISSEHGTTVMVTPIDDVGNRIQDDAEIYQNPNG